MKKLFFTLMVATAFTSCNNNASTEQTSTEAEASTPAAGQSAVQDDQSQKLSLIHIQMCIRDSFRSMDIWQTGSDSNQFLSTGWIGRYLDSNCETCKFPYSAIEVDDSLSLALKGLSLIHIQMCIRDRFYFVHQLFLFVFILSI